MSKQKEEIIIEKSYSQKVREKIELNTIEHLEMYINKCIYIKEEDLYIYVKEIDVVEYGDSLKHYKLTGYGLCKEESYLCLSYEDFFVESTKDIEIIPNSFFLGLLKEFMDNTINSIKEVMIEDAERNTNENYL